MKKTELIVFASTVNGIVTVKASIDGKKGDIIIMLVGLMQSHPFMHSAIEIADDIFHQMEQDNIKLAEGILVKEVEKLKN